jgi:hypothetical protein
MLELLIAPVTKLLDKFIPDADTKIQVAHELATMASKHAQELAIAQIAVNTAAAAHKNIFVAGARPGTLWICNLGLLWSVFIQPIASIWFEVPPVDTSLLMTMLGGLLGFGGMRTAEKFKGVARSQ